MTISLSDAGKRYNREWIFRHFSYEFKVDSSYAIIGPNGSGKSTLLQVLSGGMMLSEGFCSWYISGKKLDPEKVFRLISITAPYLELVEEMTLKEFLTFHRGFKPFLPGLDFEKIAAITGLSNAIHKQIRYYSSGMKQRLKLAQCLLADTPLVLLDEPCTNLDAEGVALYHRLVEEYGQGRLLLVSSNDEIEYRFCKERINVMDFKS